MNKLIISIFAIIVLGTMCFYIFGSSLFIGDTIIGTGEIGGKVESNGYICRDCLIWKKAKSVNELDGNLICEGFTKSINSKDGQTYYFKLNPMLGFHRETSIVVADVFNVEKANQLTKGLEAPTGSINVGETIIYEVRIIYSRPMIMLRNIFNM